MRRRARGAPKGSPTAPENFGKTHESRDEGVSRTLPHVWQGRRPSRTRSEVGGPITPPTQNIGFVSLVRVHICARTTAIAVCVELSLDALLMLLLQR
jgi:hypothetical protein